MLYIPVLNTWILTWQAEVQSMEEDGSKLQSQLKALQEHALFQEALQIKLLEECGQYPMLQPANKPDDAPMSINALAQLS